MFNLIKLCENYELLNSQTKKRVLISKETLKTSKNISFQCRPDARNYKIYYKNVMLRLKFKLWIICDLKLIHNYTNHTLYLVLQPKLKRNVNEFLTCLNLIPKKFTPFCDQFVVILLMLLRSKGEISTFSLYFQIII